MTPNTHAFSPSNHKPTAAVPRTHQAGPTPDRNAPEDVRCHEPSLQPAGRCSHSRDRLSQQRAASRPWLTARSLIWALLCGLLFCCQSAQASSAGAYGAMSFEADLVFDRSLPPPKPRIGMDLHARQDDGSGSPSSSASAIETATSSSPTELPRPFDSSLGNNFTSQSCPDFFNSFLSNQTFQDCMPFSLLLQTSSSFFTATRSPVTLVRTLDATCSVDYHQCSNLLSSLAVQLQQKSSCADDLEMENPLVVQANTGFLAYDTLYHAACLTAPESGNYCFADAATNMSAPSSSYVYYLPLGTDLPTGTRPACTTCLKDTMALFANAAANETKPISGDYGEAAQLVDGTCGAGFVQASVVKGAGSAPAGVSMGVGMVPLLALLAPMFW